MTGEKLFLKTEYRTLFRLHSDERIERENDPDGSPGPRFWLAGCPEGNVFGLRADLPNDLAAKLEGLLATEPPLTHSAKPKHLESYLSLLGGNGPPAYNFGLVYELPHAHPYQSEAKLISSDSEEGENLMHSWAATRVPESLFELGFR